MLFPKRLIALAAASLVTLAAPAVTQAQAAPAAPVTLLNSSYDVARELFAAVNPLFVADWKAKTGQTVTVQNTFGGSSRQAQAIMQGLQADVVTFNQVTDVNALARRGLIGANWESRLPHDSSPYYSTIVFLVRKGNPKHIHDWNDLVRSDVKLVFPNPKTSGNSRYAYLGAWLYANEHDHGDQAKNREFVSKLLANVESFPTGGRGATVAFAQNGQGDALLTFESEANNIARGDEFKKLDLEVIVPPASVLAEFPVAVVDKVVDQKGTRAAAEAYLNDLYSPKIQDLLATFYYRVNDPEVAKKYAARFPKVRLIDPTQVLGSWDQIETSQFAAGGILDQVLAAQTH